MKTRLLFIGCIGLISSLQAQNWQDSLNAGQSAFKAEQYQDAFRLFTHAQELAPKGVNIQELINQAAYKSKNYSAAEKGYATALKQAKSDNEKNTAYYNLGNAQFKNQSVDAAIESYKNALRKNPNNEEARYNLAYALQQKNKNQGGGSQNKQNQQGQQNQQNGNNDSQQNQQNQPQTGSNEKQKSNEQATASEKQQLNQDQANRILDALSRADKEAQKKINQPKDTTHGIIINKKDW
jgi:tetratricopeptide (TPR) repeat protein